jgi:phenylpropionate dioxygenase-like ring-hydroxylating dioxygenase large terminal subunit
MTLDLRREEILGLVNAEKGTVDRRIFSDQEIYEAELEHIFSRAWNFMAHDSQIPNPGDFFQTYIGEDRVIVVRDKEGQPQVLLNTCRHRGNAVCRAEEGHATSFMCTYHGWTYDLKGALVGVPGFKDYYHEDLNREEWGLVRAAQVDSYKGFIFATLDPDAPGLYDYLGEVGRLSINQLALKGDLVIVDGIQKYTIGCNWKLAADNVWDFYHPQITHASQTMANWVRNVVRSPAAPHVIILGEYGHALSGPQFTEENRAANEAISGDTSWRDTPEAKATLGPVGLKASNHPHIFPNMWITTPGFGQVCMRMPKGPTTTEIWWFTFLEKSMPPERKSTALRRAVHHFGPSGMLEQEDGENWDQSTRGSMGTVARRYPLNYAMNLGRGEVIEDEGGPPYVEAKVNEHAQLWLYRSWADWMAADGWADLKANHTRVPSGFI